MPEKKRTWQYISEDKTVRFASGSDVMTTVGANSVTLSVANFPSHSHGFLGTMASLDYGTKTVSTFDYGTNKTDVQGEYSHGFYGVITGDYLKPEYHHYTSLQQTQRVGNHSHNVYIGSHNHVVSIGGHYHSVPRITSNIGSGIAFIVVDSFIKLMGWYWSA